MSKRIWLIVLVLVWLGFALYLAAIAYRASADEEIVSSGYRYLGGAPQEGETCKYPDVPEIRVWGEGLAYYREILYPTPSGSKSYWGRLSPAEMREMIRGLWLQGLFTDFENGAPNPADDSHAFAVRLRWFSHMRDLVSGLSPQSGTISSYAWLVGYLADKLAVFEPGTSGVSRIDKLNLDRECSIQHTLP